MINLIQLLWRFHLRDGSTTYYHTIHQIDRLVGDSSKFINGFDSIASDSEVEVSLLDTINSNNSINGQFDPRIIYTCPVSKGDLNASLEFQDLDGIPSIFSNNKEPNKIRTAVQLLTEKFSGYVLKLDEVEMPLDLSPLEKKEVHLDTFRLYSMTESELILKSAYKFKDGITWMYHLPAVLQLVSTTNFQNNYAGSLVDLDRLAYSVSNKIDPVISTVKTFEEVLDNYIKLDSEYQSIDSMIVGRAPSMTKSNLTYANRKRVLDYYDYNDYQN